VSLVAPPQFAVSKLPPSEMALREIGNQIPMHENTEILFPRLKTTVRYNLLLCWKTLTVAPEPRAPFTIELWFNESLIINPPCQRNKRQKRKQFKTPSLHIINLQLRLCAYLSNQNRKDGRVCDITHAKHDGSWLPNKVCNTHLQFIMQYRSS